MLKLFFMLQNITFSHVIQEFFASITHTDLAADKHTAEQVMAYLEKQGKRFTNGGANRLNFEVIMEEKKMTTVQFGYCDSDALFVYYFALCLSKRGSFHITVRYTIWNHFGQLAFMAEWFNREAE